MGVIALSPADLALAALLVLLLAALSFRLRLGLARQLLVVALRTTVQLLLIGYVLHALFAHVHPGWVALLSLVMLAVAGYEVTARQQHRFRGWWSFGAGTLSMFVSSFAVTAFALIAIIGVEPWYAPQYAIPLLGMLLGNTMNGVALAMDTLVKTVWRERPVIEQRLLLGQDRDQALADIRRDAMRTGMIPIVNAMAAAGLVSLPGMMTGQILSGTPPLEAVKYQILIMFLIAAGTGFGIAAAIRLVGKRLFDVRHRLRLDTLRSG